MEKRVRFLTFFIKEFDNVQKMTVFKTELSNREKNLDFQRKTAPFGNGVNCGLEG